ncbi:MAG: hypothetical protein IJ736_10260, partial [Firmicutes bacterium]|nr:hypothetical protein [Bacillota bacterium]
YYFHSLCVKDKNGEIMKYRGLPHVGMFQDSYIINTKNSGEVYIDIRYFPHFKNIDLYSHKTGDMPLYAENIGSSPLYIKLHDMTFCIKASERKELIKENAEKDFDGELPDGDLYPATIL